MQITKQTLRNSAQIEIQIPVGTASNQLSFPFPDQPFLRGKKIYAIACSVTSYSAQSQSLNLCQQLVVNNPLPVLTVNSFFITLQNIKGEQFVQNIPVIETNPYNLNQASSPVTAGIGISKYNLDGLICFVPNEVVWTKSFLYAPTAPFPTATIQNYAFQFSVFFN